MKILLINSPIQLVAKSSFIPYDLTTVAITLTTVDYGVEIYDINGRRNVLDKILETPNTMI